MTSVGTYSSRAFYVQSSCYRGSSFLYRRGEAKEPLSLIRSSPNYRKCAFTFFFDALQSSIVSEKKTASAEFTDFHAQLHLVREL